MLSLACRGFRVIVAARRRQRIIRMDDGNTGEGIFWIVVSVLTAVFNLIAVFALLKAKRFKSPYFLLMLALLVGDALAGLIVFPLRAAEQLVDDPPCALSFANRLITRFVFLTSALLITMLAVDRYLRMNLEHRYKNKVTIKKTIISILCCWIFGIGFSMAGMVWDLRLVLGFIVLEVIVAVCFFYYQLSRKLNGLRCPGNSVLFISVSQQQKLKKSIRLIAILLAVTLIIWLPGMVVTSSPSTRDTRTWRRSSYVARLLPKLQILSSLTDPIFYFWMNREARRSIRRVIAPGGNTVGTGTTSDVGN